MGRHPSHLAQVAQHAENLDRAAEFYTRLLGHGPIARFDPPGLLFFDLGGGTRLLLERAASPAMIYIGVDDVRHRIEELRADGVTVESEPHVIFQDADGTFGDAGSDEWMAFVRDSEGNLVGLVSRHPHVDMIG